MTTLLKLLVLPAAALVAAPHLTWTAGEPLPRAIDHHATFVTTGRNGAILHVLGGNTYQEQLATHWSAAIQRDGALAPWREEAPFPKIILGHTVLIVGQTAISVGGQTAGPRRNTADVWTAPVDRDGAVGTWTQSADLPAGRFHHAAVAHDGFLYVFGGLQTTNATNTVFRTRVARDGSLGPWETLDTLPRPRSHEAAFVHRDRVFLVAGLDGNPAGQNTPLSDIISARIGNDGSLGPWTPAGQLDSAYATHGVFVKDDMLYVVGGVENNRTFVGLVQAARINRDGTIGPFQAMAPLPSARGHVHHLPMVRNTVYSVAGSQAGRHTIADVFIGRF